MDGAVQNVKIRMVRGHLGDIPEFPLPPGFSLRAYRAGDARLWRALQVAADRYSPIGKRLFTREFGTDGGLLAARQFYLLDGAGDAVGTATAWFDENYYGRLYGRVHWVAVVPRMQGRGLSKPLMTAVMRRLRNLGHDRAYLVTGSARVPAINLYLRFGFVPDIRAEADEAVWRGLAGRLKLPIDLTRPPGPV